MTTDPQIDKEGNVTLDGEHIGKVWKSTRTYSPPLYKGSRVAKYHKRVPCWRNGQQHGFAQESTFRTRREAVEDLVRRSKRS